MKFAINIKFLKKTKKKSKIFRYNIKKSIKKPEEIRNYLLREKNQNELMSKKHRKACRVLHYIQHLLIVISTIAGCVSNSGFTSLVGIPIGITSSEIGLKLCV